VGSAAGVVTYHTLKSEVAEDPSVAGDAARLERRLAELQPLPSERRIDEIGWAPDLMTARRLSQSSGRPSSWVRHAGDLCTGRCDAGTRGLRVGLPSTERVISILNRASAPAALSNEDLPPAGRATTADKNERTRIYHAAFAANLSAGDG